MTQFDLTYGLTEDQLTAARATGTSPEAYAKALRAAEGGEQNAAYVDELTRDLRANERKESGWRNGSRSR